MVKVDIAQLLALMEKKKNIRNMSIIAHVDHGKTTISDSLVSKGGIIAEGKAGETLYMDTRKDEQLMNITIKSTAISLFYELPEHQMKYLNENQFEIEKSNEPGKPDQAVNQFLINLIDSPGHIDFSSEVTAALRITDGAIVVVDSVSGVCVQTATVMRQALSERVKPVLFLNKMDRLFVELALEPEEIYQRLARIIESVNAILSTYSENCTQMGELCLNPSLCNVGFGSGLQGWAFTLRNFAEIWAERSGAKVETLVEKFWGDNFYDPSTKKWFSDSQGGRLQRSFVDFILKPIQDVFKAIREEDADKTDKILNKLNLSLTKEEKSTKSKEMLKTVMRKWLPAGDSLFQMICISLPSPVEAQRYRTEILYEGPIDDEAALAMRTCDPNGPLMMYVSKMVPIKDSGRFYALGRVFSGTLSKAQKVFILGPNYVPGQKVDFFERPIQRAVLMMGKGAEPVGNVPCGNICGVVGIDQCLTKGGTLTTMRDAHCLKVMKFGVSPVVRVAIQPENACDMPKLVDGLKLLAKSDPLVQCMFDDESKEYVVAGAGELHLQICIKDLEEEHAKIPIRRSNPVVNYRESVSATSNQICLAKSPNKLNRLFMTASPLSEDLIRDIENGLVKPTDDPKVRAKYLAEKHGFDVNEARKIICFGPDENGPNLLVDCTKGMAYMNQIVDHLIRGFNEATRKGVICGESMRGVRIDLHDAKIHTDAAHRGGDQIIPAARRCIYAAVLTAEPRLMEPAYLVEISAPQAAIRGARSTLNKRRGVVLEECQAPYGDLVSLKAYLPVNESFGFADDIRGATHGLATPTCVFDHWQILPGNPMENVGKSFEVAITTRRRKRMAETSPELNNYLDKM